MGLKKKIIVIILSIIIYFVLNNFYNIFIIKDKLSFAYILNEDVIKGETVNLNSLKKVKISESKEYLQIIDENMIFNKNYCKDTIISNDMFISKDEYKKLNNGKEIVSIKLNFSQDAASYQISKGNTINIYCSAKMIEVTNIIKNINSDNILSNDLESGYITFKLFENIQIIDCYNKSGSKTSKSNGEIIETILFEVSSEDSIKLNNLKNYANFSVSIIK